MKKLLTSVVLLALCFATTAAEQKKAEKEPAIIEPGPPPSDAIVLFDGKDLSKWQSFEKDHFVPAKWPVKDG